MASSFKIRAIFCGVFLVGVLAGGLITRYYDSSTDSFSQFLNKVADPQAATKRVLQRYQDRYHLTPEEITRIAPLVQAMTQQAYQERVQFGTDMLEILDRSHGEIAQELNPEHRAAYEQHWKDRRKELGPMLLLKPDGPAAK